MLRQGDVGIAGAEVGSGEPPPGAVEHDGTAQQVRGVAVLGAAVSTPLTWSSRATAARIGVQVSHQGAGVAVDRLEQVGRRATGIQRPAGQWGDGP
jgi:hypothetical protein